MEVKTLKDVATAIPGDNLWDKGLRDSVKGLHLRCLDTGKAWYLYYKTKAGVQRKPRIGYYPEMNVSDARAVAMKLKIAVAMDEDPSLKWKDQKQELTINEAFELLYSEHYSRQKLKDSGWGKEAKRIYEREIKRPFGKYKLSDVTYLMVKHWHKEYEDCFETTGNRALSILSKIYEFCSDEQLIRQRCNPCKGIKRFEEESRDRRATPDELARLWVALERRKSERPQAIAFLQLAFLTGARHRALQRVTWRQLERIERHGKTYGILKFSKQTIRGKTKQEVVHLSPQAMTIIDALPEGAPDDPILGIAMPRDVWSEVRKEAGCETLWARDSRRTFASVGLSQGHDLGVIAEVLNHKNIQTTKRIYALSEEWTRLEAVEKIGSLIEGVTS
jgi:integrase